MGQPGNTETVCVVDYWHNQAPRPGHGDTHVDAFLQDDFVPAPSCVEGGVLSQGLYHHLYDEGQVGQIDALSFSEGISQAGSY